MRIISNEKNVFIFTKFNLIKARQHLLRKSNQNVDLKRVFKKEGINQNGKT